MTPKQIAILNVAKILGLTVLAGAVASALLITVPLPYLGIGAVVIMMLCLIHMIYELELSKAECREALVKLQQDLAD